MKKFSLRVETSLSNIDENRWNICASKHKNFNPFNSYQFLKALELSRSVNNSSGWNSAHLIIENNDKKIVAIVPSYLKTNSSGEYVFDYDSILWSIVNTMHIVQNSKYSSVSGF